MVSVLICYEFSPDIRCRLTPFPFKPAFLLLFLNLSLRNYSLSFMSLRYETCIYLLKQQNYLTALFSGVFRCFNTDIFILILKGFETMRFLVRIHQMVQQLGQYLVTHCSLRLKTRCTKEISTSFGTGVIFVDALILNVPAKNKYKPINALEYALSCLVPVSRTFNFPL